MKNYITFLLSLTATLPLFGSPSSTKLLNLFYPRHKAETIQNRKQAWKSVDTTPSIWKAGKSDTYRFNSSDEWEKEYTSSYNYRKDGLMTEEIVNYGAYSTKTEYQYNDEILTDLLTSEIYYEWNPDSQLWEIRPLSTYLEIERDNNGNVVSEKVYTHNGEEFELTQTVTISYDDNGIADYIKASIDFFGVTTITMENIVWEETDGQLILGEYYLFLGNNKNECPHVTKLAKFKLPSCPKTMFWNTLCKI